MKSRIYEHVQYLSDSNIWQLHNAIPITTDLSLKSEIAITDMAGLYNEPKVRLNHTGVCHVYLDNI